MDDPVLSSPKEYPSDGRDDLIRRSARVLAIIQQIATQPHQWSRRRLAEQHEISERMVQKDLELIRVGMGLPLEHDGVAYFFTYLPHLPTTAYTFSEALALLMAARTAQAVPGVNSAELAAGIARLESIFPEEFRPLVREATERLPAHAVRAHRQTMLTLLHRALIERRQVRMGYVTASRAGKMSTRVVEPYHILPYGRSWHLIAYDHQREDVLQFKVDRVHEATLLDTNYVIPASFDVDAYLGDVWGMMRGAAGPVERVALVFEPEAGRWVAEETWHSSQQVELLVDGSVRVTFQVGVTPEMVNWLMHYGARVRVLEPEHLRLAVLEGHRQAVEMMEG